MTERRIQVVQMSEHLRLSRKFSGKKLSKTGENLGIYRLIIKAGLNIVNGITFESNRVMEIFLTEIFSD